MENHPRGARARILLTSVFGPYAQDDEFGSRKINPMELYHNQVTREQGPFSLRMFHRSWGILMIQQNISAPTTVLDFPTRQAFEAELTANQYDIVGISSIIVNVGKVREMCRMVRRISPKSTIVVGGHVTAIPGIEKMIDADHIVRGDGISWMRHFLGEDETAPIKHPAIVSGFGGRALGMKLPGAKGNTAATIIPSVGCPMGCNFCTTSAFFGGKGKFLNFFDSGSEIYSVMSDMEARLGVKSFFVMDENFLLHKRRAMELLDRMKRGNKPWSLYVFSSANAIRQYSMRELVELGISWVWMGLESPRSRYDKLKNTDTIKLTHELRQHGHQDARLHHRRPGASHAAEHRRGNRLRRLARHRFPPVHAVHARPRHAAFRRDDQRGPHAGRRRPGRYPRPGTASISSTPPFPAKTPSGSSIGPSAAISNATVRASTVFAAPRSKAGCATRTTPIRASARVSHLKLADFVPAMLPPSGGHGEAPAPHQWRGGREGS